MAKIIKLKTNRMFNPIGFSFERLSFSFDLEEEAPFYDASFQLLISTNPIFDELSYRKDISLASRGYIELDEFKLKKETRYYWKIIATLLSGDNVESELAYFETGLSRKFAGDFIAAPFDDCHPIIYKDFTIDRSVEQARLYISGLGLYEAYVNDGKIGDEFLAPYCNDYDAFVQYQTYPIDQLKEGKNTISVLLGNGWYKGRFGIEQRENIYGDRLLCIAELHITYLDGTKEIIKTDKSWQAKRSQIIDSNIYDGEHIDYRKLQDETLYNVDVVDYDKDLIVERKSLPIVQKEILSPKLLTNESDEFILDFGQNMVGFVEFKHQEEAGKVIKLKFGEILQDDHFYRDNLRTAKTELIVTSDGRERITRSHFTFYGFRYVKVEGMSQVNPGDFKGVVIYSDLEQTGFLKTSNEKINRLIENALWSQKGNFLDVPTDCPQRDERLGWTADAQVFVATASFNMDSLPFYEKYLNDLKTDQQLFQGGLPNYSPSFKESIPAGSVWGDAATIIPSQLYKFYGDKGLLKSSYSLMKNYLDYVKKLDDENGSTRLYQTGFHFGDWLAQDGMSEQSLKGSTDDFYIASMYYYYSSTLVAEAARTLKKEKDYRYYLNLANEVKQAILNEYFSPNGRLSVDTQTGYLLSLAFEVYIDKAKVIAGLKDRLKKDYYRIKTGFVGTPMMCRVLVEVGMVEEAYRLLFEENHPSWLYAINLGATTIWERWNSVLPNGKISGTNMNSLNHYSYGSIVEFIYSYIAGIKPTEPGFKAVHVSPTPHYQLKEIECTYQSVSGKYYIYWKLNRDGYLDITVKKPLGTKMILTLPQYSNGLEIAKGSGQFIDKTSLEIESLEFSCRYLPSVQYNYPYSKQSVILDLLNNDNAREILREKMPNFYDFINGENDEFLPTVLEETAFLPMCYTAPHVVEEVDKLLQKIYI